jgi:hypothetical protein
MKQDNLGNIHSNGPLNSRNNNKPTSASSNKNRKKKKPERLVDIKIKFEKIYYMGKLEFAYKSYSTDHYPSVFRQHFKQTLQSISILSKLAHPSEASISDK